MDPDLKNLYCAQRHKKGPINIILIMFIYFSLFRCAVFATITDSQSLSACRSMCGTECFIQSTFVEVFSIFYRTSTTCSFSSVSLRIFASAMDARINLFVCITIWISFRHFYPYTKRPLHILGVGEEYVKSFCTLI